MKDKNRPGQNIKFTSYSELLGVSGEESAMEIDIRLIDSFHAHPFKVLDDERMEELTDSIRKNGVMTPVLLREKERGRYEMISGHRRMHAAKLAGLETIPAIIRDMTEDEAVISMVDSNIQREELLPSEKAWAFKMKMDALRRQGHRTDLMSDNETSNHNERKLESADLVSASVGISKAQVRRYIRLTELIPEILELVDKKRMKFTVAVEVSYIDKEIQSWINEYFRDHGFLKLEQVNVLREHLNRGEAMTQAKMISIMNDVIRPVYKRQKVTITSKQLDQFFGPEVTELQAERIILQLLQRWKEMNEGSQPDQGHPESGR